MNNDFKKLFEKIQKNDLNREENQGVIFCNTLKKIHAVDEIDHKETKKIELKNNETKETKANIRNERDLYNFYKNNLLENNRVMTKSKTHELLNISVSTIARYNNTLKEKNLLYTKGKYVYLNIESKSEEV